MIVEILEWMRHTLENDHVYAAFMGITVGVALAEAMAHFLPPTMAAYEADRLTRLVCFGVSCTNTFWLDPTSRGFFLAVLAGLAGPTVHGLSLRYINQRWPGLTPRALIDAPGDEVRPLVPKETMEPHGP